MTRVRDENFVRQAIRLAKESEIRGNLPVGAVVVLQGEVIAEGPNELLVPHFDPARHAEIVALSRVDKSLWPRAKEMEVFTTLEPCIMCFSTMVLHGVGRIVFGARDLRGGASFILDHLPPYYADGRGVPRFEGPILPDECNELYRRCDEAFAKLPCGVQSK